MICPICNTENNDDARYCENCGHIFSRNEINTRDNINRSKISNRKNHTGLIVAIVAVGLVALVAICVCIYFFAFNDNGNDEYSVWTDITSTKTTNNETTTTSVTGTTTEAITQSETTTVLRIVPNITGMFKDNAVNILKQNGIKYRLYYEYSSTYDKNYVFSQSPSGGEFMHDNDVLTVYISRGSLSVSDEYILPESNIEYISETDIVGMDKKTLELALNEIYARHGRKFNNDSIQSYFNQKDWYDGFIEPNDFSDSVFNKYETKNIATIDSYMKKKGYR